MVEAYLARLRERYGHLDIESLLPLDSQQEQIPVGVREVFVAQTVRLIATDPAAPLDLPAWCHLTGHTYLGTVDGQQRSTYAI